MTAITDALQTGSTTLDQQFISLSHPTRRRILITLAEDNPRDVDEFERSDFTTEDGELEQFIVTLHHNHLPQLADAGFIDWDRESNTITRGPNFEEIRPLVTLIANHQEELPENWP
ncbi:DUF7344 domain-containing protein [Haloprofundus halophilus]